MGGERDTRRILLQTGQTTLLAWHKIVGSCESYKEAFRFSRGQNDVNLLVRDRCKLEFQKSDQMLGKS